MRPLDVLNQDWVHGCVCDGMMNAEFGAFIKADAETSMNDWEALFKSDLRFPHHYNTKGAKLWRVFNDHRNPDGKPGTLKGDASEMLGLYALMRHFIELRFRLRPGELAGPRASFDACCKVVDIILQMKTGVIDPKSVAGRNALEEAIFKHLECFIATYGPDRVKPKHFLNHELPKQFKRKGVFDAFITERLHLRVKDVSENTKNLDHFETTVLSRVQQRQLVALKNGELGSGLRGRRVRCSHAPINMAVSSSSTS